MLGLGDGLGEGDGDGLAFSCQRAYKVILLVTPLLKLYTLPLEVYHPKKV